MSKKVGDIVWMDSYTSMGQSTRTLQRKQNRKDRISQKI